MKIALIIGVVVLLLAVFQIAAAGEKVGSAWSAGKKIKG